MNFVSIAQLHQDLAGWERTLPDFDAVCGIPRSGLLPSSYLAVRRNVPHLNLTDLADGPEVAFRKAALRGNNPAAKKERGTRVLIVDDSTSPEGRTIKYMRQQLQPLSGYTFIFAAVYRGSSHPAADYTFRHVGMPRMFEWNWFRHQNISRAILDIDGVLCEDWTHRSERNVDPEFVRHVEQGAPLWIPQRPVLALATSRLERYRPQTEEWLRRHGVCYKHLYMHPAATPEARRAAGDHAQRKAEVYRKHPEAMLFVESSEPQAAGIRRLTRRPVLCIATMRMQA